MVEAIFFEVTFEIFDEVSGQMLSVEDVKCHIEPTSKGLRFWCDEGDSIGADINFANYSVFALQNKAKPADQMIYAVCDIQNSMAEFLTEIGLELGDMTDDEDSDSTKELTMTIKCKQDAQRLAQIAEHYKAHHFSGAVGQMTQEEEYQQLVDFEVPAHIQIIDTPDMVMAALDAGGAMNDDSDKFADAD